MRKAQYQFGWDWGPRLVTAGIWKDIQLEFWNNAKIITVKNIQNKSAEDVRFEIEIEAQNAGDYTLDRSFQIYPFPSVSKQEYNLKSVL